MSTIIRGRAWGWVLTAVLAVPLAGCADSEGMGAPTAPSRVSAASTASASSAASASPAGLKMSGLSGGVTDVTLANAGWACIQPGNGLTLCFPPGLGAPPFLPEVGAPTYTFMAFTADHQFVHRVTLRRADLYHGEPCLGGGPWDYLGFLNLDYFECINPARAE